MKPLTTFAIIRAKISRLIHPGYSWCGRCGMPWASVDEHSTPIPSKPGHGCFPLCEQCWSGLTVEERTPFYLDLLAEWQRQGCADMTTDQMLEAVTAEGHNIHGLFGSF